MKTRRKNKLRCTAVPEPCVQLCIRRKFRSCIWSLHTFTSKHLHLNHPPFWPLGVVTSWSGRFGNENFWKSVGLDRPVKEDHLWRWTTEPFHLLLDRNFRHNGKQPKSPCSDLFMLWLIKLITNTSPNHFSGPYVALRDWFAKRSMHFGYWYLPRVFWNL